MLVHPCPDVFAEVLADCTPNHQQFLPVLWLVHVLQGIPQLHIAELVRYVWTCIHWSSTATEQKCMCTQGKPLCLQKQSNQQSSSQTSNYLSNQEKLHGDTSRLIHAYTISGPEVTQPQYADAPLLECQQCSLVRHV